MFKLSFERKRRILEKLAEEFNVLKEQKKALRLAKRRKLYPFVAPYDVARRLGGTKPTQYELAAQKSMAKRLGIPNFKSEQLTDINDIRRMNAEHHSESGPGTPSGYHDILRKKSIAVEPRQLNIDGHSQRFLENRALAKKQLSQRAAKTEIKKRQDTAQQSLPLTKLRREASGG